ncbi:MULTISPECIES: glyceraldehyde 3-phosphate dehydrogenase NAD-binding domain-containing protein [unclassified Spirosoma]|uniref:type I glyceraldehyde-3-phosphate dehydrogenase n=1 Tax=unclassified Spirosoma TaxID=2621999 RepID=UPI00096817EA|nr:MULTISPECIES: glyceraldehyde 3-phosphate dehydrogenase NAD-binding domain-containing protein [unclassified Spirosoma]MBN8822767.1 aldehyde dehydrogenase [Spirosoma sp.]OJW79977.1 MAG: glyceraldehyde-3-phosphate dehydrogenase [Spirosoma sp. 48-14]
MTTIGLYGFGRIGRQFLRIGLQKKLFVPTAIADIRDEPTLAALFAVDTNYGRWHEPVSGKEGSLSIGDQTIPYINSAKEVPDWKALGVDLVVDCTGRATTRAGAQVHIDRGAKYVLISAPSKTLADCDAVLLKGINLETFDPEQHKLISMGSCTTNALAAVVKVISENFGIQYGLFSTVHSYTNTQSLTDQPMKDRRDSWAAAENIIPSSSGAARALQFIWKDLKITGKAYRVPTRTGSIAELNLITEKDCSVQEVNDAFRKAAAEGPLHGVLDVLEDQWASSRIVADPHSSIIDLPLTAKEGNLLSVAAWYDNEWGFSNRLAEVAAYLAERIS